jgi:hypothetical protein
MTYGRSILEAEEAGMVFPEAGVVLELEEEVTAAKTTGWRR